MCDASILFREIERRRHRLDFHHVDSICFEIDTIYLLACIWVCDCCLIVCGYLEEFFKCFQLF